MRLGPRLSVLGFRLRYDFLSLELVPKYGMHTHGVNPILLSWGLNGRPDWGEVP